LPPITPQSWPAITTPFSPGNPGFSRVSLVPGYWIYYACSRRTVTPVLYGAGLTFLASFAIGIINSEKSEQKIEALGQMSVLVAAPIGFKFGTNQAREFAKKQLENK
jgi:hypothetical protein